MRQPRLSSLVLTVSIASAGASTQSRPTSEPTAPHESAIDAWLSSDAGDAALLASTVEAVLGGGKAALRDLAAAVERVTKGSTGKSQKLAAELLLRDVALGYLESVRESDLRYAGQFEPLDVLQPWVGRIFLQLVTSTPEWFPDNMRVAVIPALRDIFPKGPGDDAIERLRAIATDTELQPSDLRHAIGCALAQWGDRSLVTPLIAELEHAAGPGETADELHFVRRLAALHYELREYATAARHWTAFLRGSEKLARRPAPIDYYNAACSLSLSGHVKEALDELDACSKLLRGGDVDESLRLERDLFDRDPDLRAVRPTRRFQQLVDETFAPVEKR